MTVSPLERYIKLYNGRLPTERDPKYLELLAMGKYAISDTPYYKPGKCANCGCTRDDGRKYVDFDLEIDWYGKVYLCTLCLKDIATACGFFTEYREEIEELQIAIAKLEAAPSKLEELHANVIRTTEELKEHYANLRPPGDGPNLTDSDRIPKSEDSESGSGTNPTERKIEPAKPRTTKSTSSAGRKDIPNLTELLNKRS